MITIVSSLFLFIEICKSFETENCSLKDVIFSKEQPAHIVNINFTEIYHVIELENSTGAKSLDGSNFKFYFTPGQEEGIDKFFIYWQGGAFCASDGEPFLKSCYEKLGTMFGSSDDQFWGANGTLFNETTPWGSFSSMKEYNPLFWNWNKVRLLPMDGSNYQGYLEEPLQYNNTNLWFRGFNNTMSTLEYMRTKHNLFNASEIILSGGSAGGVAAMVWSSYLKDYFPPNIKIKMILDGSMFLDAYSEMSHCYLYRYFIQTLVFYMKLNSSELYKNCPYRETDIWKCLIVEYIFEDVNYPVFISNCQTDTFELTNMFGVNCLLLGGPTYCNKTERGKITHLREKFLELAFKIKTLKPHWGYYFRSCFEHSLEFCWAWYNHSMDVWNAELNKADNLQNAISHWYNNEDTSYSYIDVIDWLHNPLCMYYGL